MWTILKTLNDDQLREVMLEIEQLNKLVAPALHQLSDILSQLMSNANGQFWSTSFNTVTYLVTNEAAQRFLQQGQK